MGFKFSLIEKILDNLKRHHRCRWKGSLGWGAISSIYSLSEAGRVRTRDCLERNRSRPGARYARPICRRSPAQRLPNGWLTRSALAEAYSHMVMNPEILTQVGPRSNSGKSFLIYGQAGNGGGAYMAEALLKLESAPIYVPYALECQGTIVRLFDPVYHRLTPREELSLDAIGADPAYDGRWARCYRPFIVTGST